MSISAEEKVCYLREAAIVLAKEGFQLDEVHTDRLCILLDGSPLCEVTGSGGVAYRNEDIDEPERIAAKDKVYEIVRTTAEYMQQMEMAPFLKADGLEDGYKVLADFNGTVLAGVQSKHGVHFVTWDWAYGHTGVFIAKTNELTKQLRQAKLEKEKLMDAESDMTALQTRDLIDILEDGPEFLDSFDTELFGELVEKIIIESNDSVRFCLKNGLELRESIERTVR